MYNNIIHTYKTHYESILPPGLGDFIKGTLRLCEIAQNLKNNLYVDYSQHPISQFLDNEHMYKDTNIQTVYQLFNTGISEDTFIDLFKKTNSNTLRVATNSRFAAVDTYQKLFIKRSFIPNKEFSAYIEKHKSQMNYPYNVLHIRLGDVNFNRDDNISSYLNCLIPFLSSYSNEVPLYVIADNQTIKQQIKNKYSFVYTLNNMPIHLGCSTTDPTNYTSYANNGTAEEIKNTLLDFFIMSTAKHIFNASAYNGLSGFSSMCSIVYDVPITLLERLIPSIG